MKKVLSALILVAMFAASASAAQYLRVGALTRLNSDAENFSAFYRLHQKWDHLPGAHRTATNVVVFHDSIMSMMMALGNNDIEEMDLPEVVAAYVLNERSDFKVTCTGETSSEKLAFGFLKNKSEELRDKFNGAIESMKSDGTLEKFKTQFLSETVSVSEDVKETGAKFDLPVTTFTKIDGAPEIRVAVTGDLPPIDYVAADGRAAGYNAALLAEIAKRIGVNVRLVYVNAGARSAALVSGRADVVFWYQLMEDSDKNYDVPDDVIVSEPYYEWTNFVHIGPKND